MFRQLLCYRQCWKTTLAMVAVFEFNAIFGTCSRIPTIQKLLKYGDEDAMMKLTMMMTNCHWQWWWWSAQVVAVVSCLFVIVSTLCLIFSTLPQVLLMVISILLMQQLFIRPFSVPVKERDWRDFTWVSNVKNTQFQQDFNTSLHFEFEFNIVTVN